MGWLSGATRWVKKNVVKPVSNFVTETVPSFFDKVGDVLESAGNFISGLASVKFGTSGTVSGGSGNDIVVGLDFGSVADFLRLSFSALFSKQFWSSGQLPSSVTSFANDNSNRIILDGNAGNDTMFAFGGLPTVYGDDGNDRILALGGENRLFGGSGNDFIVGAGVINTVWAGTGNDTVIVLGGKNTVRGEGGDDNLTVFGALNDVDAGAESDLVIALGGSNTVRGGTGNDRLFLALGGNFGFGDAGNDLIAAAGVANALYGGSGADTIIAIGAGNLVYGDANSGNVLGSGNGTNEGGAGNDVIVSFGIGNLIWAEGGNDVVTSFGGGVFADGGAGSDTIVALAGGNVLLGGDGTDVLVALGTVNALSGGAGDDVVVSYGTFDLSRGGAGDDIMVGVGIPVVAFQLGDAGQDIIVGVGGTVRIQFGDDPFSFVPGGDGDDDAKRDGILGFVEQTLLDFQFTDFEFEDLSLPTLPTLDDLDSGALDAGEAFVRGVWGGMKGVYGTLSLVTELFDPDTYNTDRLFTAFAELEFPNFTLPNFSGLSFGSFTPFGLDILSFGDLDGFSAPATPDLSALDGVALGYAGFDEPLDPAFSALSVVVPNSGARAIGLPDVNTLLPNLTTGFSASSLNGVASYFPGESLSTAGLPSLAFGTLLDLDGFALPDADGLLSTVAGLDLPSFAALDALGATFGGLSGRFESAGLFQPGSGRGSFQLPALSLPQISLPSFDLYAPSAGDSSDILASIAGGSLLFGQEDDDLLIGASLANFQFGGSGADILVALAKGNLLSGGQDDDVMVGLGLLNLISGGEGSDIIGAGGKFNLVAGGTGEDLIIAAGIANILLGGSGRDVMGGGGTLNILAGGADGDLMLGGGKFNVALAGAGDDLVLGGGLLNVMLGGEGDDLVIGFGKFNSLLTGEGNDIAVGGGLFNVIDGDIGDDLMLGGGKFNLLYARGGNDALVGGGVFNSLIAGQGTDLVLGGGKFNLFMSGTEVDDDEEDHDIVFVAGRYNTFFAGAGDDLAFVGGGELNTAFLGSGQDIVIAFSSNLNFILGQEDADIILGAGVGNIYAGGTGNDLLFGFGRSEQDPGQGGGDDTTGGGGSPDLDILTDGSVVLNGDFGDDLLIAGGTNVQVSGGSGNDKVLAAGALNFVDGDEGYDFLFSALGLSALDGGTGNDVIYSKGTLPDIGTKSLAELVFDGGDVQGGKGSDLIWANGSDIEVFGDTGVSIFSPDGAPDGGTRDEQDGDDVIVISGARSEAYGQGGDDLMLLFGSNHRADGGAGADLMIALGNNSEIDGGAGEDEVINIGGGLARAFGGEDDDLVMGKGYTLLGWLSDRGDAVWTEFSDAVITLLGNIGELIENTIVSVGSFRGFDGSQITGDYFFAGRDGLGAPGIEVIPSEEEIRDAEVDAMTSFVFALIDEYGIDGLGSALEQLNDPSFATFAPSYDTLAGDLVQAAVQIASPVAVAPFLFGTATDLSVSALVALSPTAPNFFGGTGNDVVSGRVGLSTLLAGAGDDTYAKAVGERVTIIDEEGLGGDDTLTITAYATDLAGFGVSGGVLRGLTSAAVSYELADLDGEGTADDLIIRIANAAGDIRSLTVIMDQLQAESAVETLILNSGVNGGTEVIDLAAASAAAGINAAPTVDASELSVLVTNDIALLESELGSSAVYNDLFLYDDFGLDEGATSGGGQGIGDLETALDGYFSTLETVEPGASTVGNGTIEQTLDGEAFAGAPSVTIPENGAQVFIEDGVTLQVQRFQRDLVPRFDVLMSSDGSVTDFRDAHAFRNDPAFIEAVPRGDVALRFTGIDRALTDVQFLDAMRDAGLSRWVSDYSGTYALASLEVITSDSTDMDAPIDLRSVPYVDSGDRTVVGALFLDGEKLGGLAVRAEGFRSVGIEGDATLISLGNAYIDGGEGSQTVEVWGDSSFGNLGLGDDVYRLFEGSGTFVGAQGTDLFEISIDTADANRSFVIAGNSGGDIARFLPLGQGGVAGGSVTFEPGFNLIDLSQIGPDATIAGFEGGFRILLGGGEMLVTLSSFLPRLLWTDGIQREIVPSSLSEDPATIAPDRAMFVGPTSVSPLLPLDEFRTGSGDDLVFGDKPGSRLDAMGGDDIYFIALNPSTTGTEVLAFSGNDTVNSADPDTVVVFASALSDYRIVRGFDGISVVNDTQGMVTTVNGPFASLRFEAGGAVVLSGDVPDTPVTDIVAIEDTPLGLGLAAPAGLPASGVSVRVKIDDTGGTFERISTGEAIADLDVLDPADLPDIRFVPTPDFFGPAGSALLQLEVFDDRGVLDRIDYRIAVTGTDDPVVFGFDGLTTGEGLELDEGLPAPPLQLSFSDVDLEYDGTFRLYLAPGASLPDLVIDSPHSFQQGTVIGSVAELQGILAATTITWGEDANGVATFVLDGSDAGGLGVLTQELRVEAVDDPETFTGVPTNVLQLPENTNTELFPTLGIASADGETGQYRVEVVATATTIAAGGGYSLSPWPTSPGGIGRDHPGGARSSEDYSAGPGLSGFSIVGTIDQLNQALDEVLFSGTRNYEGAYDVEVRLYKVTGDLATRDPFSLIVPDGEEFQDSFIRNLEFTPGVNAPLAERGRSYYMPADIGTVALDLPEPYDPDFLLDNQPDFTVRILQVPDFGELRLADGTVLSDFTNISVSDWVGLTYTPDAGLLPNPPGVMNPDGFSFYVTTPLGPTAVTQNGVRLYVFQDEEEVPDGGGGTTTVPVNLEYFGSLSFDSPFSNSIFFGGDGDDTINPFNGIDMMLGGAGADTFVIDEETGEFNVIGDFQIGVDIIDFGGLAVAQLVEDFRFTDSELTDTTLDTILILTNGAELVLENVTGFLPLINVAPLGGLDTFDVSENPAYATVPVGFSGNVLANDVDQNGDPFFIDLSSIILPQHGTLDIAADGSFTYTPEANFFGVDRFAYTPTDGIDPGPPIVVTLNVIDDPLNGTDDVDVIDGPDTGAVLSGNGEDDVLNGGAGDDTIYGGMGADVIVTGGGNDVLHATLAELDGDVIEDFSFADRLFITDARLPGLTVDRIGDYLEVTLTQDGTAYSFSLGTGSINLSSNLGYMTTATGETEFTVGRISGDTMSIGSDRVINGGSSGDVFGRLGNDVLQASSGGTFFGGDGDDLLSFTSGSGALVGGRGSNVLQMGSGTNSFLFDAADFDKAAPGQPQMQTIRGYDPAKAFVTFNGFGVSALADLTVTARHGGSLIDLGADRYIFIEDTLPAALDPVRFTFDQFSNGSRAEIVNLEGNIVLSASGSVWANSGVTDDTVTGRFGADSIAGGGGNDLLQGNAGDDTLSGGSGDDTLVGGEGVNILTGGAGRDTFVLSPVADPGATRDIITDFELGIDQFIFDAVPGVDSLDDIGRSADENGLELDLGGGRTVLLPGFTLSETFSDSDFVIVPGGAGGALGQPGATALPPEGFDADAYVLRGFEVSLGAFNTARVLGDLGATIELGEARLLRFLDTDGVAQAGSASFNAVEVGGDEQGAITGLHIVRLDPVDTSLPSLEFALIERDLVADHLLVPLGGSANRLLSAGPEALGAYVIADLTAFPDDFDLLNLIDGSTFDDSLFGTNLDDQMIGGDGSDVLAGGAGDDVIVGGSQDITSLMLRLDAIGDFHFQF